MKRTLTAFSLCAIVALSVTALAQGAAATSPGGAASAPPVAPSGSSKVGIINIQQAILASNEGRRDFEALAKKYEPRQAELQKENNEIDELKKQLNTQGDKMNDDAKNSLVKQIESRQRKLQQNAESFQSDAQAEQNDLANRIGQKLMTTLDKFAKENGYGLILDVSTPQSPVLWANVDSVDVTNAVVNAYNVQSGVPAPPAAAPSATRPAAPAARPAGTGTAPVRPATTTPPATNPPPKK
ncbi:MAG TPA: OmpH family outer membrane protein [Terriglobales bacterium]|nr:OmpH family outer membrane protein [Terriglobales bacterium]